MNYRVQETCEAVDFSLVRNILKEVDMGFHESDLHQKAFENSFAVVFVFDAQAILGFGRAISDGAYQAALYDVAVAPSHQGYGVGRLIVERLLAKLTGFTVILYASPGKEGFYSRFGFAPGKTCMALFRDPEKMRLKGMI